jgi:hypothetical protein
MASLVNTEIYGSTSQVSFVYEYTQSNKVTASTLMFYYSSIFMADEYIAMINITKQNKLHGF